VNGTNVPNCCPDKLFLPKHYEAVANNLLSGERVCSMRLTCSTALSE
jgi:hypothetical protein